MRKQVKMWTAVVSGVMVGVVGVMGVAGPLDPPAGPVASTYKTLSEVEPRIAVNATNTPGNATATFRITQPGSYYLTGNVIGESGKNGIQIASNSVTLDLNGFTLLGVSGSLSGVFMASFRENVVVCNGHVRGWGQSGLTTAIDVGRIERIVAARNGAWGIDNSNATFTTHIVQCEVVANGMSVSSTGGIRGGTGAVVSDCVVRENVGIGISVGSGSAVRACVSTVNTGEGIVAGPAAQVVGCDVSFNSGNGIRVGSSCVVSGNRCSDNGFLTTGDGANIHATGTDNRIEGNNCTGADRGIDVDLGGNFITRNTCSGNTLNWDVVAGNYLLVINGTAAGAVSGNSGGVGPGSTDPNANFTY